MSEKNYDFRKRHWEYHKPDRRDFARVCAENEVMLDESWAIGCNAPCDSVCGIAVRDFRDYLETSMNLSLRIVRDKGEKVLWIGVDKSVEKGFVLDVKANEIKLLCADDPVSFRATIYLEDMMNLEEAPVLTCGKFNRTPIYRIRQVHSGSGMDVFTDEEFLTMLHAGYNAISVFMSDFDRNRLGYYDYNDVINRGLRFGIKTYSHNYIRTFVHPDDADAQARFDAAYGEVFHRYPNLAGIGLCGEALEFPSKDPHTTGKNWKDSVIDGIPDTRPSPGWYPCYDYPAYIQGIEKAVHKANPNATVSFSTYNWGYESFDVRKKFLENFPKNVTLSITYDIFTQRRLEGYHTPVMDYTISAEDPSYFFTSEGGEAHKHAIPMVANVNTAGIAWDFGCVPLVPAPYKILKRDLHLRNAYFEWGLDNHYTTHHFGYWNNVAADLGKWTAWEEFEPDYEELLYKIAVRDYGKNAAAHVVKAWKLWSEAMNFYTASNEDQYGPWRVGAAYPFVFHPNISRTMANKDIKFPTAPHAHFGHSIIKTFYNPYENVNQTPGFLRYPAELRSLAKMLELWNQGLDEAAKAVELADEKKKDEARRLEALGHFIRNSTRTTVNIKKWWRANIAMLNSETAEEAETYLDTLEEIAANEIENARDTIPSVEFDSRLGWEPSMEYVCDKWHLEWKIRQVNSALIEIASYRRMLNLHKG